MAGIDIKISHYTTLCKRQKTLKIKIPKVPSGSNILNIAIDSTGLKIYGEGEWKVKIHGKSKRRTWRKLHLGIDLANQSIVSAKLTTANVHDAKVLGELLPQKINTVLADGIYDTFEVYENSLDSNGEPIIPPRSTAAISSKKSLNHQARNNVVKAVKRLGPKLWKQLSGYHKRSLVETAMSRLKRFFGSRLKNRSFKHQEVESYLRCSLINHFTELGMPISIKI